MKRYYFFALFLITLFSNQVVGQELYRKSLDALKKQPASAKRDSAIVYYLFSLSKLRNPGISWNDSLRKFSIDHKSTIGYMLWELKDIEIEITNLNYGQGIKRFLSIAAELEKLNYKSYAAFAYLRAGIIYVYSMDGFLDRKNAIPYYTKALQLSYEANDKTEMLRANDYMGELYFEMNEFDKAILYLKKAEELIKLNDDKYMYPSIAVSLSAAYFQLGEQVKSDFYYKRMNYWLDEADLKFDNRYHIYINYIYQKGVASRYLQLKQYDKADFYAQQGLKSIKKGVTYRKKRIGKFENYSINLLKILYVANSKQNKYKEAFMYLEELYEKQAIHQKSELDTLFQDLNMKYQTDQNKLKITALQNENLKKDAEKQTTLAYVSSAAIILLLLIISIILYSNFTLRKKNKEIAEATLKGQTLERHRVAADLHDNLGTTLTSLQWTLSALDKRNLAPAERDLYQTLTQRLDQAYNDVRLLAHNLMPIQLAKTGLGGALQTFVDQLNHNNGVQFVLTLPPDLPRFEARIEFEVYSICLELCTNILKHARATEAHITLLINQNQLSLTVSDNGVGLTDETGEGRGLQNIRARTDGLGGTWQITSEPGQGVRHQITVPVRTLARAETQI
jgi:signal transduction histidine kinase